MKVQYPNPSIKNLKITKPKTYGMLFENALNTSNEYYLQHSIANIHKKPTPIQVVKVDYPKRAKAKIIEAYYKTPSTTDYNGIYRGKYIDYEAKETNNLSFNFKHISLHQILHLKSVHDLGGLAFVIIYYKKVNRVFIIDIAPFYEKYMQSTHSKEKAISIQVAEKIGCEVTMQYSPPIDYLKSIDLMYFKTAQQ